MILVRKFTSSYQLGVYSTKLVRGLGLCLIKRLSYQLGVYSTKLVRGLGLCLSPKIPTCFKKIQGKPIQFSLGSLDRFQRSQVVELSNLVLLGVFGQVSKESSG